MQTEDNSYINSYSYIIVDSHTGMTLVLVIFLLYSVFCAALSPDTIAGRSGADAGRIGRRARARAPARARAAAPQLRRVRRLAVRTIDRNGGPGGG